MIHSFRLRLLLLGLVVVAVATGSVALLAGRATRLEFERFIQEAQVRSGDGIDESVPSPELSESFTEFFRERGSWDGVESLMDDAAAGEKVALTLLDPAGTVAASSPAGATVERGERDGAPALTIRAEGNGQRLDLHLTGDVGTILRDGEGRPIGTLIAVPRGPAREPDARFLRSVDRALIGSALLGAGVALLVTLVLSRQVLRPVGDLTRAARRMEQGEMDVRVPARSRDEFGQLGRAFNAMAERLAQTERLRRTLVTDVAHELRGPLTNLRGGLEALQDGLTDPDAAAIDSLHEDVLLLDHLLDDLQDLALAESGGLALTRRPIAPAAAIERSAAAIRPRLSDRGVLLILEVPPDLPPVNGDERRIGQVLRNLFDNAAAHTPEGGRIAVRARRSGPEVEIAVTDTGTGIAAEHLPHIFDRFYRVDASRARSTGGTGLGLAIVRGLVQAHGGRAWVESVPGKGSTFSFTVPVAGRVPVSIETSPGPRLSIES